MVRVVTSSPTWKKFRPEIWQVRTEEWSEEIRIIADFARVSHPPHVTEISSSKFRLYYTLGSNYEFVDNSLNT